MGVNTNQRFNTASKVFGVPDIAHEILVISRKTWRGRWRKEPSVGSQFV